MTAFDFFQSATCDIADGNRQAAAKRIDAAIVMIDADGIDAEVAAREARNKANARKALNL